MRPFRSSFFDSFCSRWLTAINGHERHQRSWSDGTVYQRSSNDLSAVYERPTNGLKPLIYRLYRWYTVQIWTVVERSIYGLGQKWATVPFTVPFRSVPIQDRRVKNRPSLVWIWLRTYTMHLNKYLLPSRLVSLSSTAYILYLFGKAYLKALGI